VKRGPRQQDQNLDPLLDTMANVVGILVMLVAVTQLPVADAVDRIRQEGAEREVSEAAVAQAEREREELERALAAAGERLEELEPGGRPGLLLPEAVPLLDELTAFPDRAELRGLGTQELQARVDADRVELDHGQEQLEPGRRRATQLDELLRRLPTETRPKIARLPDPRPPPADSQRLIFLCRHGRIVFVDRDEMDRQLTGGIMHALGENRMVRWEDRVWVMNLFDKTAIGRDGLRWKLREDRGNQLFADILMSDPEQGESLADLRLGGSRYAERLRQQSPKQYYIRYFVWPDSFDVYLEARYLAESRGYLVSWTEVDLAENVGRALTEQRGRIPTVLVD